MSPAPNTKPNGKRAAARSATPRGTRWRFSVRSALPYAVAAAAGFLLAYVLVYLFVFPSHLVPDDRPVPDVRGQLADDAERALRAAGFAPQDGGRRVNASVPPGTVLEQSPAPATEKPAGVAGGDAWAGGSRCAAGG